MNALKSKWKHQGKATAEQYLSAAYELTVWFGASSRSIRDLDFSDPLVFKRTRSLAERYVLDLSDAFQIVSVEQGYFSGLARDSRTVLVTADGPLASAARAEGLRVWDVRNEAPPK